jgi:hypothetical protein
MSGNGGDSEVIKPVIDFVNKAFELPFSFKIIGFSYMYLHVVTA